MEKEPCVASNFRFCGFVCSEPAVSAECVHHRMNLVLILGKVGPVQRGVVGGAQESAVSNRSLTDKTHHVCDAAVDLVGLGAQPKLGMALLVLGVDGCCVGHFG